MRIMVIFIHNINGPSNSTEWHSLLILLYHRALIRTSVLVGFYYNFCLVIYIELQVPETEKQNYRKQFIPPPKRMGEFLL